LKNRDTRASGAFSIFHFQSSIPPQAANLRLLGAVETAFPGARITVVIWTSELRSALDESRSRNSE
jgi:hypothetical protein